MLHGLKMDIRDQLSVRLENDDDDDVSMFGHFFFSFCLEHTRRMISMSMLSALKIFNDFENSLFDNNVGYTR